MSLKEKLFKTQPRMEGHYCAITIMQFYNAQLLFNTLGVYWGLQLFPIFVIAFSKDCFHSSIVNSSLIDGVVFADIMFAVVETSEREREKTPNQTEN